jgi:hypothetical protein
LNVTGAPAWRWYNNGWNFGQSAYSPGAYRTAVTPYGITQMWYGPSGTSVTYNPWLGYNVQSTSAAVVGYTFNPYVGFRPFAVPSWTYASGLNPFTGGGFTVTGSPWGTFGNAFNLNSGVALPTVQLASAFSPVSMPGGGIAMLPLGSVKPVGSMAPLGDHTIFPGGPRGPAAYNNYIPPSLIMK